jgi:hypothetical protein
MIRVYDAVGNVIETGESGEISVSHETPRNLMVNGARLRVSPTPAHAVRV